MFRSKEKDKLFSLLIDLATLLKAGTAELKVLEANGGIDVNGLWKKTEKNKEEAQLILNQVMRELDLSLITPIEREDILHLAERLAGALSALEACAARFDIYGVEIATDKMIIISNMIVEIAELIALSVDKLSGKRFGDMQMGIQKIYGQVEAANLLERAAIRELFSNHSNDPVTIIKHKEIYDYISRVVRQQEKIAKVLGTIIMKNA